MFRRGHLDHLALTAASRRAFDLARERLVERGASNGTIAWRFRAFAGPTLTAWR
jgi:hypothetical protein